LKKMGMKSRSMDSRDAMPPASSPSPYGERPVRGELYAAIATALVHIAIELNDARLNGVGWSLASPQTTFNFLAAGGWSAYLIWRGAFRRRTAAALGFRTEAFAASLWDSLRFAIPAVAALMAFGAWTGRLPLPRSFWLCVAVYPLWGLAQQFVLQSLVTRNLRDLIPRRSSRVAAAATLFALAHTPNGPLMALTFLAGLGMTWVFERRRNLWAIGIVHGILGALAYYLVLGHDPGAELLNLTRGWLK
jgi:membrane protease YdiL (CAAX protease family)